MISIVDKNGDGKISYSEFRVMLGALPLIMDWLKNNRLNFGDNHYDISNFSLLLSLSSIFNNFWK